MWIVPPGRFFLCMKQGPGLGLGLLLNLCKYCQKHLWYSWDQIIENWDASGNNMAKLSIFSVHRNHVRVEPAYNVLKTLAKTKTSSLRVTIFDILGTRFLRIGFHLGRAGSASKSLQSLKVSKSQKNGIFNFSKKRTEHEKKLSWEVLE